jgi:hypothetical protein
MFRKKAGMREDEKREGKEGGRGVPREEGKGKGRNIDNLFY